jgi:hypothetical protein
VKKRYKRNLKLNRNKTGKQINHAAGILKNRSNDKPVNVWG